MTDKEIETEIQNKKLTAPRIKPEDLDKEIKKVEYHLFPNSQMTICCLTLKNGFNTIGESACVDPANFDAELGQKIALNKAKNAIWPLLGFNLKQKLYEDMLASANKVQIHKNQTDIYDALNSQT